MKKKFALQPFAPVSLDLSVTGEVSRIANQLIISYRLTGDLSQILIPSVIAHPHRQFELWEATCFEFFIAPVHESYYWEFNLAPSGNWNVFRLDDYRQGLRNEETVVSLPMQIQQNDKSVTLDLQLSLDMLIPENQALDMSVTTVIQDRSNNFSYWALQHTGEAADFHQRDDFILKTT
jgi:hypothetical protein